MNAVFCADPLRPRPARRRPHRRRRAPQRALGRTEQDGLGPLRGARDHRSTSTRAAGSAPRSACPPPTSCTWSILAARRATRTWSRRRASTSRRRSAARHQRFTWEAIGFHRNVEDLIVIDFDLPAFPDGLIVNSDAEVEVDGFELIGTLRLHRHASRDRSTTPTPTPARRAAPTSSTTFPRTWPG